MSGESAGFELRSTVRRHVGRFARHGRDVAGTMTYEMVSFVSMAVVFPLTTRALGVDLYGRYTVLYLIFGLAGLWVHSAPSAALVQLILQLGYDSKPALKIARRQALIASAPAALLGTALAVGLLGWEFLLPAFLALGVDFGLTSLASLNMAVILAVDGVVPSVRLHLLQPLLRASGVAALALGGTISVITLVVVNIAASGVLYIRSSRAVRRIPGMEEPNRSLRGKELVRYSSFYATSMSTNAVQNEGEKFVLASARPAMEVGQYTAAYRIVSLALIPLGAVMSAANRWFLVRDDRKGAQLTRAARLSAPAAVYGLIACVGVLLGRGLVEWAAGSEFDDAALIAGWLCLLPLLHGLAELPPMGLLGLGRNRERMFLGFGSSAGSVLSYLLLVPPYGWRGAVIGTYVTETLALVAGWLLLVRYQRHADDERPVPLPASTIANSR